MRSSDGVAWFLASAMLLLTLAGCGVFGLGALLLLPSDRLRDRNQSMERVAAPVVLVSPLDTPTMVAPTAMVVVEVAPTAVAGSGLVLLPLVLGPVAATFTPWPTAIVADPFEGCFCTADVLDCGDTADSKAEGRRCYAVCMGQGSGDVHNLDGNSNGDACED